jgi:phospholipase C
MLTRSLAWKTTRGAFCLVAALACTALRARADGHLQNVNHVIILMQENHSFDNYFGILPYVPGTPYHSAKGSGKKRACSATDNTCVDGLSCTVDKKTSALKCKNSNKSNTKGSVKAFHDPRFCIGPDLDHGWEATHLEVNFKKPNETLKKSPNDGYVRVNADRERPTQAINHDTMGYYDDADLPFYFGLAQTFAISDRYFCSVLGPTFPNRAYLVAATSFGHLTTSEDISPEALAQGGYKPITGTIYSLLNANNVSWTDYYSDLPYSLIFQPSSTHQKPLAQFAIDAAAGNLPAVAFIDPSIAADQLINGSLFETDEHPPADIRAGEYFVSNLVAALRNSPSWNDSVLIITYDEHGGSYDHVTPPPAPQGGASTPDGIAPGQCADLSNPPASTQPGGGLTCTVSATSSAPSLCPSFTPTGPYPSTCATFNQLGVRVPFIAVSPFTKPQYVSHTVADHTSILALIEKRFLNGAHMTARDQNASTLEDMFDFDTSPSLNATIPTAPLPAASDPGCPFTGPASGDG